MGRFYCLLAASLLVGFAESMIWEFGQDSRSLSVIAQSSGRVKPLEKVKKITLPVPTCMEIKHVLVDVYNQISTPAVNFNKNTATVTISYKLLQSSWSSYDIVARGRKSLECSGGGGGGDGGEGRPGVVGGRPGGDYHSDDGDDGFPENHGDSSEVGVDTAIPANVDYAGGDVGNEYPENDGDYPGVGGDNGNPEYGGDYPGGGGGDEYVGDYKDEGGYPGDGGGNGYRPPGGGGSGDGSGDGR